MQILKIQIKHRKLREWGRVKPEVQDAVQPLHAQLPVGGGRERDDADVRVEQTGGYKGVQLVLGEGRHSLEINGVVS